MNPSADIAADWYELRVALRRLVERGAVGARLHREVDRAIYVHDEAEEEETDNGYCGTCAGSGEGMADGTTCGNCGGSGEDRAACDDGEPW